MCRLLNGGVRGSGLGQGDSVPNCVTLCDITKLPEMSTSVYGAGPPFGTHQNLDCFCMSVEVRGMDGADQ